MIDVRRRFSLLLTIVSFNNFCQKVCQLTSSFTKCSIAIWDYTGTQRTKRWMFHQMCVNFYNNEEISPRCDHSDANTVKYVLEHSVPQSYVCWAGFTCLMIPIIAENKTIGLISVGEFHTDDHNDLSQVAKKMIEDYEMPVQKNSIIDIPKLSLHQIEGIEVAVTKMAGVISDIVTAKINPNTLSEYLFTSVKETSELIRNPKDEGDAMAAALQNLILTSLSNLYFQDLKNSYDRQRSKTMHNIISPLSSIIGYAEEIDDSHKKERILAASKRIQMGARKVFGSTDVVETNLKLIVQMHQY
jgi:ligand-binding sensor protein